jgi:hypothetical protein
MTHHEFVQAAGQERALAGVIGPTQCVWIARGWRGVPALLFAYALCLGPPALAFGAAAHLGRPEVLVMVLPTGWALATAQPNLNLVMVGFWLIFFVPCLVMVAMLAGAPGPQDVGMSAWLLVGDLPVTSYLLAGASRGVLVHDLMAKVRTDESVFRALVLRGRLILLQAPRPDIEPGLG